MNEINEQPDRRPCDAEPRPAVRVTASRDDRSRRSNPWEPLRRALARTEAEIARRLGLTAADDPGGPPPP